MISTSPHFRAHRIEGKTEVVSKQYLHLLSLNICARERGGEEGRKKNAINPGRLLRRTC